MIYSFLSTEAAKDFFLRLLITDFTFMSLIPFGLTFEHAIIKPVNSSQASKYLSKLDLHSFPHFE